MVTIQNTQVRVYTFQIERKSNNGRRRIDRFRLIPTKPLVVTDEDFALISALPFFGRLRKEGFIAVDTGETEEKPSAPISTPVIDPDPSTVDNTGDGTQANDNTSGEVDPPSVDEINAMTKKDLAELADYYEVVIEADKVADQRAEMVEFLHGE